MGLSKSIYVKSVLFTEALPFWFSQNYVSPWLTAVLYSYIPLIIIIVCNIGIVYKLKRARAARSKVATSAQDDDSSRKVRQTDRQTKRKREGIREGNKERPTNRQIERGRDEGERQGWKDRQTGK